MTARLGRPRRPGLPALVEQADPGRGHAARRARACRPSTWPWPAPATPAQPFHLDGVRDMLAAAGLTEADLQNTPDLPYDADERDVWIAAGRTARPLAQNCSGKHAAMLATCRLNGWDLAHLPRHRPPAAAADGRHPRRPRRASRSRPPPSTAAAPPSWPISLAGLARAFGRIAAGAPGTPEAEVTAAMRAYPEFVGGTRRDVTALIRGTEGLIAKDGAEAVHAVGPGRRPRRRPQGRRRRPAGAPGRPGRSAAPAGRGLHGLRPPRGRPDPRPRPARRRGRRRRHRGVSRG